MFRLIFVSHSLPPVHRAYSQIGGTQRFAGDLLKRLEEDSGIELHPMVLRSISSQLHIRLPFFFGRTRLAAKTLVSERRVDGVLFSSMANGVIVNSLGPLTDRPGVVCGAIAHGEDVIYPFVPYQVMVRGALKKLDCVFAISKATERECLVRGAEARSLEVVPSGIEPERFMTGTARRTNGGTFELLSVGRLTPRKGIGWFVEKVMPSLPRDVEYTIVGEGPEKARIQKLVIRKRLEKRVQLAGRLSDRDLSSHYQCADLFVMPNIHKKGTMEGLGLVLLEAAGCGLPAVASDLEGISDAVQHQETGLLVPAMDPRAWRLAIERCRQDPEMLSGLGSRAGTMARSRFTVESALRRILRAMERARSGLPVSSKRRVS